jgi:AmmeMemoRadiSam system protein B
MPDDRPRLRPLDGFPVDKEGEPHFVLRDPSGLSEFVATLPALAVAVVQLCDGAHTRDEIRAEFARRYRAELPSETLDALLGQLDEALLLDSPRFREHAERLHAAFAASPVRAAALAGRSYPGDPAELAGWLDSFFTHDRGPGAPIPSSFARPRAIVAPHIDFHRGGPAYAWAYRALADSAWDVPDLVVVFGTDHNGVRQPFTLTRKHYETPLGPMQTDVELVERLAAEAGGAALFADEWHHRGEHSIEFQAVWLRYLYGERADGIRVLPILCGSLHEFVADGRDPLATPEVGGFLAALARAVDGRNVLWIAGADLAHVGPQFGDEDPIEGDDFTSLELRDHETLQPVCRGDAAAWLDEIRREEDRRRVCGLAPIYALLAAARPDSGRVAIYAQCPAEGGSIVSIASVVF